MNGNARLAYKYAEIDLKTGRCIGVITSMKSEYENNPAYIPIPKLTDEYLFKYYINGAWYEDAEGTIPWSPTV